ncbi:hypothetical protein Poly51_22960 [Rubripirellula tenax]|uniref:Uncharacterized protein n=1 Tax=Rubripirellula tenax TaxID=2528015 RepID=A0A5C6F8E0_9BACT|nr:hypothetical protein [Rubripirellula tenax]TWU56386.1 hypothetical protein Poly51_22960 [Rubripirellula tenax]
MMWLLMIPFAWVFVSFLLARISGWSRLVKPYSAGEVSDGAFVADESARFRTATLGAIQYHSCVTFGINDTSLRMSMPFLFRLGHPPLVIPWDQIHRVEADNRLYSHRVKVSIGKPTLIRAALPGWVRYRMPMDIRP